MSIVKGKSLLLAGIAALAFAAPARAQTAPTTPSPVRQDGIAAADPSVPPEEADIVVTALRQRTSLQTTPATIAVISGEQLAARGISNVQDLASAIPGISFGVSLGQAHIAIRGIGADNIVTAQDPRVAFYQDGVYIPRTAAQLSGMFDVDRVEALKGPQGTLYGRNATGGALNVLSRAPGDKLDGYVNATYGSYDDKILNAAVGGPIDDKIAARIAFHGELRGGYGRNITTGDDVDNKRELGVRFSLKLTPTDGLSLLTIGDFSREKDNAYALHLLGQGNAAVPVRGLQLGAVGLLYNRDIASDTAPLADTQIWGINETVSYDIGRVNLRSITAYRFSRTRFVNDVDGTSLRLSFSNSGERSRAISEELQLTGHEGSLDWLVGGLFFREINQGFQSVPFGISSGGPVTLYQGLDLAGEVRTTALAPYARLSYKVTDRLTLTAGGRYTSEEKAVDDAGQVDLTRLYSPTNPIIPAAPFPRSTSVRFKSFTPSATLDFKVTKDIFTYFTYSQGFKSGGYSLGVATPPYRPEKIKNYEFGVKATLFDQVLRANLAAFHYDYTDLQVALLRSTMTVIENAASARINGIEGDLDLRPVPRLDITGSFAYLDSKYTTYVSANPSNPAAGPVNLAGNQLTQAPKFTANASIQYRAAVGRGSVTPRAEVSYVSRTFFTPFNELLVSQPRYALLNASLRYETGNGWSAEVFLRNVADKLVVAQSYVSSGLFGYPIVGTFTPPRTVGVRLGYDF